ncbi:hypothetical protein [Hoylesella oralis]|uniref:hypothetical protein n=1 Tax=Hoylesella oralis TaxID=28134 RepID=UPI0028F04EDD|nr:hypothetical protein [Hoylesella oralis]
MKKISKYIYMALAGAFISIGAASCTDEYEYTPAAASKGNAYINAEGSTVLGLLPTAAQTFNVKVVRSDSAQAGTVHLTSSNTKFQVPAEVTFNAGEKTKTVSVSFNIAEASTDTVVISVASDDAYEYGPTGLTYVVTRYQKYEGTYVSTLLGTQFDTPIYKIGEYTYLIPASKDGWDYDITFTINKDNSVVIGGQRAFNHSRYGTVYMIGNAKGDAKVTAEGVEGSGVAGTYDTASKTATLKVAFMVPGVGSFGTKNETIVFTD